MPEIKFETSQRAVTAAATPERLFEGNRPLRVITLRIRALTTNAGNIYIGNHSTTALSTATPDILTAGEVITIDVSSIFDAYIDLANIWIDSDVNGDGVSLSYFEVLR